MPASRAPRGIIPAYAGSTSGTDGRKTSPPDHPRIRGEHRHLRLTLDAKAGSSPHTRGARHHQTEPRPDLRIIPAYAGSTPGKPSPAPTRRDHPRIRGEHFDDAAEHGAELGSSPHTRGARRRRRRHHRAEGIIPAYAGSTPARQPRWQRQPDHPRIRGEHGDMNPPPGVPVGSSPHTRGARGSSPGARGRAGIIPAYAGSTGVSGGRRALSGDHPRIRGEHAARITPQTLAGGSSPHTRGARLVGACESGGVGIIPAYAGSTSSTSWPTPPRTDHPRIRGEHRWTRPAAPRNGGSSPHTRGARPPDRHRRPGERIIPAYAGSTSVHYQYLSIIKDHPRIRGEHPYMPTQELEAKGSSPHTRGAQPNSCSSCPAREDHPRIRGEHPRLRRC